MNVETVSLLLEVTQRLEECERRIKRSGTSPDFEKLREERRELWKVARSITDIEIFVHRLRHPLVYGALPPTNSEHAT